MWIVTLCAPAFLASASELTLTPQERAYLDSLAPLRVQALGGFPPFSFVNEQGYVQGYTIDYMTRLAEVLDTEIEFVANKPWHEYLQMLKSGELDIIPHIAVTPERQAFIDYTPFNHIEYSSGVAINANLTIKNLDDLEDKVIAIVNKSFLHSHFKKNYPHLSLLPLASTEEAAHHVSQGKADVAVASLPGLNYYIQKDWLSNLRITTISGLSMPAKTAMPMGVAKGNSQLMALLIKAERTLPYADVAALKRKWMQQPTARLNQESFTAVERQFLRAKKMLTLCVDPSWLPMEALDNGRHIGIAADFLNTLKDQLGVEYRVLATNSWAQSLQQGRDGKCDLFPMIMNTKERKSFLDFTAPYIKSPLVLVTDVLQPYHTDISALKGFKVGISQDYAFKQSLTKQYPEVTFVDVAHISDGLDKVRQGELYGYVDSLASAGYWIQNNFNGELKVSGELDNTWLLSMGVQKHLPLLTSALDKAIAQVSASDRQSIINNWVSIKFQRGTNWFVTLVAVAAISLIAAAVIFWYRRLNKMLRKEIQRRKQAEHEALYLAKTDQLTGLLNRHGSTELLSQEMARSHRGNHPVCLMLLDVDHFKRVNDRFGHQVGDEVLKALSHHLVSNMRATDHMVRWGGEEFLILVADTNLPQAMVLAEKFRHLVETLDIEELPSFTVSIGVTQFATEESFAEWYKRTDAALYQAKHAGRNRSMAG